jgi:PBP1b-binding outer membrane lipoprotein LpoB
MKKVVAGVLAVGLLLAGCSNETLKYEGKRRSVEEVENMIEAKLQMDNIDKDVDVEITIEKEFGSSKTKVKKHGGKR